MHCFKKIKSESETSMGPFIRLSLKRTDHIWSDDVHLHSYLKRWPCVTGDL